MSRPAFATVDEMLAAARSCLERVDPVAACRQVAAGAWLVDIRPHGQRIREGEIPGALVVERNHLEWRLHPASTARLNLAASVRRWIVFCSEGYTSSLAAHALCSLGVDATDLIGGFRAWQAAGLPTVPGGTAAEQVSPYYRWVGDEQPA
ncbi:MAG: rhodanese-like domain-containing protein [Nocardioidaceae bacterium]